MRNIHFWLRFALSAICLFSAGTVRPACDRIGKQAVFGIEDIFEIPEEGHLGRADFTKACDELIACYSAKSAIKTICERTYEKNLKNACRKAFEFRRDPLGECLTTVDNAAKFVAKENGEVYRRMQRTARAREREEERKARAQERQARIDERRKKRRDERIRQQ